jgi:hypothetical protein
MTKPNLQAMDLSRKTGLHINKFSMCNAR